MLSSLMFLLHLTHKKISPGLPLVLLVNGDLPPPVLMRFTIQER